MFGNGLVFAVYSLQKVGVLVRRNFNTEILADVNDVRHSFILLNRDLLTARRR